MPAIRHRLARSQRIPPQLTDREAAHRCVARFMVMIRKLKSGYRIYSRHKDPRTGKRRNLGTFETREAAQKHEREIQYFKQH